MSDRQPATIENDLKKTREEMTQTVDQLVSALSPKDNAKRAKASILAKTQTYVEQAQDTVERAKSGDRQAQKILAGVGVGATLVLSLIVRKILR